MTKPKSITRRDLFKLAALGLGGLAIRQWGGQLFELLEFPQTVRLGRAAKGTLEIKARPNPNSTTVGVLYEDGVLPWLREIVGEEPTYIFNNLRYHISCLYEIK